VVNDWVCTWIRNSGYPFCTIRSNVIDTKLHAKIRRWLMPYIFLMAAIVRNGHETI